MSKSIRRAGFTLIELLVVISIIGILVGMLLPAVQKVREAARRTQCTNHQRNIVMAMMNFESALQRLPAGISNNVGSLSAGATSGLWNWSTFILPQLEQQNIYDILNPVGGISLAARYESLLATPITTDEAVLQQSLPIFLCPSDSTENINLLRINAQTLPSNTNFNLATTSYVVAYGSSYLHGINETASLQDGSFGSLQGFKLRDFTDGQSNTLMIGERTYLTVRQNLNLEPAGAGLLYGVRGLGNGAVTDATATVASGHKDTFFSAIGGINYNAADATFSRKFQGISSRHPAGVVVAFGDGSTRFLTEAISIDVNGVFCGDIAGATPDLVRPGDVYRQLISRRDGHPQPVFE